MENERGEFDTFFTGLSSYHGTKPGSRKTNETFSIKFEGISPDNKIKAQLMRFIKFKFETCYDWSNVMAIALECLDNYFEDGEFQEDMELCVGEWLAQFEGWGLLFTLLPMDFQQFLWSSTLSLDINIKKRTFKNLTRSSLKKCCLSMSWRREVCLSSNLFPRWK